MTTTTLQSFLPTKTMDGSGSSHRPPADLMQRYRELLAHGRLSWTAHPPLIRQLGRGGQGIVFLSERRGADKFTVPLALKIFSPERYEDTRSYEALMARVAAVASRVALIQHDNLLDVQDFYDRNRVRVMAMEWIDGSDLRSLLCNRLLLKIRDRVSISRWEQLSRVVFSRGAVQPRIKPGVAIAIVRECLGALAALHRCDVVHGDIKPGNIMLKRTGHAKIIDIGSAFESTDPPVTRACTPAYAAPEVLDGAVPDVRSDLASLGYVLIELLSGQPIFPQSNSFQELLESKREMHQNLDEILPVEVARCDLLMDFCRRLIAPDPSARFDGAESADLESGGAADFQRQLVLGDLDSEYINDIRVWLEEVKDIEELINEADTQLRM